LIDGEPAKFHGRIAAHPQDQLGRKARARADVPRVEEREAHETHRIVGGDRFVRDAPVVRVLQPAAPVSIVLKAQIEQCVRATRGGFALHGGERGHPSGQFQRHAGAGRPAAAVAAHRRQIQEPMIQVAQRPQIPGR